MSNTTKKIIALIVGVIAGIAATYIIEYRYIAMRWAAPLAGGLLALFLQLKLPKEGIGSETSDTGKKILGFMLGVSGGIVLVSTINFGAWLRSADLFIPLTGGLFILFIQSNISDSDLGINISQNSMKVIALVLGALVGVMTVFYFNFKTGILDIVVPVVGALFFWFLQSYLIKEEQ